MGIRYQLPNGKYVYLTLDEALDMDLESLQDLMADDSGYDSEDPFDDHLDNYNPVSYNVPEAEPEILPTEEKIQIKKDIEDGD